MSTDRVADFDLDRILAETFVREVRYHESIPSTNTAALEYSQQPGLQTPLLVIASRQTDGRGRGSNTWWSAAGALTFSLVLDPARLALEQRDWPKASLVTGLGVCLALGEWFEQSRLSLKWPNDVYLDRHKLSGILIEAGPQALVIGIGINVNNSLQTAPSLLQSTATSMIDATGREFHLHQVLTRVLQQLEKQLTRLTQHDPTLREDWQRFCALTGRTIQVVTETHRTTGVCQGIDETGALLLLTESGLVQVFSGVIAEVE